MSMLVTFLFIMWKQVHHKRKWSPFSFSPVSKKLVFSHTFTFVSPKITRKKRYNAIVFDAIEIV